MTFIKQIGKEEQNGQGRKGDKEVQGNCFPTPLGG